MTADSVEATDFMEIEEGAALLAAPLRAVRGGEEAPTLGMVATRRGVAAAARLQAGYSADDIL